MNLSELRPGESGIILKIKGRGAFRRRIIEMGFIKGREVKVIKNAPLQDPIEYKIMDYNVSLRRSEASLVEVLLSSEVEIKIENNFNGVLADDVFFQQAKKKGKVIEVALVGNPNSGKTTLFNYVTNSAEHVGNYCGVTVDSKQSNFKHKDYVINLTDLPGTYSLSAYSPEELFIRKHISESIPDVVVNVIDASNIERNLYLTTQLIDMDIKVVIALNMFDELNKKNDKFDYDSFGKLLGIPVIPTISAKGEGIDKLFDKVIKIYEDDDPIYRHIHINCGETIEESIKRIQDVIKTNTAITDLYSSRFYALKLLEKDKAAIDNLSKFDNFEQIKKISDFEILRLESYYKEDSETLITDARYGFINGALKETYIVNQTQRKTRTETEIIDTFLTNRLFGLPIFIVFIWLMFYITFYIGNYPKNWLEQLVTILQIFVNQYIPQGIIKDLLSDGIIGGVGSVIVFLPNIMLLFLCISLMEDTGYMARAAFITDRIMHKVGLHGKSFIPLLMGFGCNVPAIMATRSLNNYRDRIITILINPFMSCSARLPVYVLITGTFFAAYAGTVIFLIYLFGILLAAFSAIIMSKFFFKAYDAPFVMELPPYRLPTSRSILFHMWSKAKHYLRKMGGLILIASIVIWALGYFPRNVQFSKDYNKISQAINNDFAIKLDKLNNDSILVSKIRLENQLLINNLENEKQSEKLSKSFLGIIGKYMEPIMSPLGFDWKMSVSLLSGIVGKEVVVSTLSVLMNSERHNNSNTLQQNLITHKHTSGILKGKEVFTPEVSIAFLIFILIYFPCIAVIATISKESGHWKYSLFTILYTSILAWTMAFAIRHIFLFLNF